MPAVPLHPTMVARAGEHVKVTPMRQPQLRFGPCITPLPQGSVTAPVIMHEPQSLAQLVQVSVPLHIPSPQRGAHAPQSRAQLVQVSVPLHIPSPHRAGHAPQTLEQ